MLPLSRCRRGVPGPRPDSAPGFYTRPLPAPQLRPVPRSSIARVFRFPAVVLLGFDPATCSSHI